MSDQRSFDRNNAAALFDAAIAEPVARSARKFSLRAESPLDVDFLDDLSLACSSPSGLLPDAMLLQQARFQRSGYAVAYPAAMRRIVICDRRPVGRLMIDWGAGDCRCVDIAILPEQRGRGLGTSLLCAWLAVADRLALPATLNVQCDSPAVALYRRLGLVAHDDAADAVLTPMLTMSSPR